ncbi:MAG TPA: hypothetical protein VNC61_12155 [Acidimicrobiales bacterium]|nr:hypothetical protein [Acidimicrobiales bacterium]
MIEMKRFRLSSGTDEEAFREADRRVQAEFAYRQAGLLRRTVARSDDGTWIVIDLWRSADAADAAGQRWGRDPATTVFMSLVDADSVRTERYTELD